jgi:hypothetical protein
MKSLSIMNNQQDVPKRAASSRSGGSTPISPGINSFGSSPFCNIHGVPPPAPRAPKPSQCRPGQAPCRPALYQNFARVFSELARVSPEFSPEAGPPSIVSSIILAAFWRRVSHLRGFQPAPSPLHPSRRPRPARPRERLLPSAAAALTPRPSRTSAAGGESFTG